MNDRRGFLRPSVLAAGAADLADSSESLASTKGFPAGIVYTAAKPGKWAGVFGATSFCNLHDLWLTEFTV